MSSRLDPARAGRPAAARPRQPALELTFGILV